MSGEAAAVSEREQCECVRPAQSDLCPVCGEHITLNGSTTDGRLIGSCGDAFTRERWEECPNCGGEVKS